MAADMMLKMHFVPSLYHSCHSACLDALWQKGPGNSLLRGRPKSNPCFRS